MVSPISHGNLGLTDRSLELRRPWIDNGTRSINWRHPKYTVDILLLLLVYMKCLNNTPNVLFCTRRQSCHGPCLVRELFTVNRNNDTEKKKEDSVAWRRTQGVPGIQYL